MPREALYNWRAPHTAARSKCPAANPGKYGNDKKLFGQYWQPLIILFKSLNMCNVQCVCTHRPMPSSSQSNSFTPSSPSALTAICCSAVPATRTTLKRLPPKGLHCKTQEDVGSIVSIGFHQMGGPRWKNHPGMAQLITHLQQVVLLWQVILKLPT